MPVIDHDLEQQYRAAITPWRGTNWPQRSRVYHEMERRHGPQVMNPIRMRLDEIDCEAAGRDTRGDWITEGRQWPYLEVVG
jgi:hypothetical protein